MFWAAADLGWAVGHSYGSYGSFLHANPSILYEVIDARFVNSNDFLAVLLGDGLIFFCFKKDFCFDSVRIRN